MKRSSQQIKKSVLQILKDGNSRTFADLERKINTGYRSILSNCKELEIFGAITIEKLNKHESNGKPYFHVSITASGREILKKL